jgi:hypothetical protein
MEWFGPILAFIGVGLLLYGFNRNRRDILFAAGAILFLAGALSDFLRGFADGIRTEDRATSAVQVVGPSAVGLLRSTAQ